MKFLDEVPIRDKKVLFRVDFNVPLDPQLNITDDTRIITVLPSLQYAMDREAKVILMSHLGRPKGKRVPEMSLAPVADHLRNLLNREVRLLDDCIGSDVAEAIDAMKAGEVVLLENLRFHAEEEQNDDTFSGRLGALCDVYVNDAFAVSHRRHASVVGITKYAPVSVGGFLLKKELDYFEKAMTSPRRPLTAIIGGAKVSSKLGALKNMLHHVDNILIGGAMANTFLKSQGMDMGSSKVETDLLGAADSILKEALAGGIKIYLPKDAVVAQQVANDAETKVVSVQDISDGWMALDIGPATVRLFAETLQDAQTIVWNGPLGVFEMEAFSNGTMELIRRVARSRAMTIVGGGDTDVAVHQSGETDNITYISTGGGAFLALLEGKTLPAVAALNRV